MRLPAALPPFPQHCLKGVRANDFGILLRSTMPTRGVSCKANGADRYARRANSNSLLGRTFC